MPSWRRYGAVARMSLQTTVAHRGQVALQAAGSLCWVAAGFAERLVTGRIAVDLSRPMSLTGMRAATGLGEAAVGAVLSLPMWLVVVLFAAGGLPLDAVHAAALALSLLFAIVLKAAIVQAWSLACIWTDDAYSVAKLRIAIVALLSGAIVPLSLWPEPLDQIAALTPFAALVQTPFDIATGNGATVLLLMLQLAWCGAVVAFSALLWRLGSARLNVHGG
jgi:ABC-2 type transport system permease protein